jgi:integrase
MLVFCWYFRGDSERFLREPPCSPIPKSRHCGRGAKPYKASDSGGLYVLVTPVTDKLPKGSKLWRLAYRYGGKQKTLSFGVYPAIGLGDARAHREEAKAKLRQGIDPGMVIKAERVAERQAIANTFGALADQWEQKKMIDEGKSKSTLVRTRWLLGILKDGIGDQPLNEIEAPELLDVLRKVEAQGKHEAVKRLRSTASTIFRFGIACGACKRDPAADLRGALTTAKSTPHAAITDPAGVGKLLRAIDAYEKPLLRLALKLLALTFVRPGNVAAAEWREFDIDAGAWSIPAEKMKKREPFRAPLSRQAIAVLAELRKISGTSKYLFPSFRTGKRPMFTNLLNVALRDIGYAADEMQAHGFRSAASTILNEHSEFSPDVIELSLAHRLVGVRAIYNRSEYWTKRCELMQWYADHLDKLRERGRVIALPDSRHTSGREA